MPDRWCEVVELRQYTLHPGKRDELIDLFDREFVESQEALGARVIGQFRDLNDSNRFVWLRGFSDMESRKRALTDFYTGPVWKAHREVANATMVDSDNVLLLRPARRNSGFMLPDERPAIGSNKISTAVVLATIYYLPAPADEGFVDFFENVLRPILIPSASILAYFATESSANTFPRLPVREGENVLVWFSRFSDAMEYENYLNTLLANRAKVIQDLDLQLMKASDVLKLSPTNRSLLR